MTLDKISVLFLKLLWILYHVAAIQRQDLYPYGMFSGDVTLQEGDDETSRVITLTKPMYFYEASFRNLYVATNGIISTQDLPMEKQYVDDGFPTDFPVIAPFLADIDTSNGKGSIYYRQTESPTVLKQVEGDVKRGFPDDTFTPTHAFIATWENVSAYEEVVRSSTPSNRMNTFQVVLAYNEKDTYALFLYPEDGLQFFGTRPKESYNVEIELPARVGFTRGELSNFFSRAEGPYYSVTNNDEQSIKNLYQKGNTGLPGVWLFHIGNSYSFQNVVPAPLEAISTRAIPVLDAEFTKEDYTETDEDEYHIDPDFQEPTTTESLEPEQDSSLLEGLKQMAPLDRSPLEPSVSVPGEFPWPETHYLPPEDVTQPQRPPLKHAIQQVYPNQVKDVPPHSGGQVFSIEEKVNFDSGVIQYSTDNKETCEHFQQQCSQNARCMDYSTGFCCHCNSEFYGNGRQCLPNGAPHRVNGKVRGTVSVGGTPVQLDGINLHAYIVVGDGRAYSAISEVPEPLGWALMPVAPIGGLFGWLFALELPNSFNGFSITGAEFTRRADVTFYPGHQRLSIVQTATGLDTQNYLNVDTHLQGSVPFILPGATVQMEPFKDTYHYYPSLITSTSVREFTVMSAENGAETFTFQVKQNITYRFCSHGPFSGLQTQELRMERIFVMFVKEEHILRYAMTNKIGPVGAGDIEPEHVNPCYSGNHDCDTTAQCVPGEGQLFTCQCATGYQGDGHNCYDVDECAEGLSSCGAHSHCVNLPGSHRCQCHGGFEFGFDGRTCQDVDECRDQPCHSQALCSNTQGSFQCQCQPGFHGDGFQCYPENGGRPKTQCEQHRDSLQRGTGGFPQVGAFIPQCDEEGQYRPLQCHGSTGHCWCVDGRGQERVGTRTPPGAPPRNCVEPVPPVHPKTQCEQHRDSLQGGTDGIPLIGAFIPQCDEEGQYRPLQCHGSTGHCWCVDSRGQERVGTRTPPGAPPRNCDEPVPPTQRLETVCERWRASLLQHYGGQPESNNYLPQCDSAGEFNPVQCYGDSSYCWCVDRDGREVSGTRSHDAVKPACIPTVAPPTTRPLPRPDVTPPPTGTSLLYAQGQQIGVLPLNGTQMDKERSPVLLALHGSIVVGIDYDCRERKVYWTDLAGRTINRAGLEPGSEPEIVINTGISSPEGLAVDVARRRLFWVDSTPDKIETSNLDGSDRRVLFDTDLVNPRAIIVDSPTGTLYWTDWNREAPKIESSSVDGQNRKVLVRDGIGLPNALTYDSTTSQVCWADAGTKRLECISPNGTGRRVVHSNLNYPFSMVFYANHYYYTDWRRDGVIALSRDSQFTDEYLPDQRSHLYGITVAPPHCL